MIFHDTQLAADTLQQGALLAYPTESVWGIGCDPFNARAFDTLLSLKNRPADKGVILIASDMAQVAPYLTGLSDTQKKRIADSWQDAQQATTWVVPLNDSDSNENKNQNDNSLYQPIPEWITGTHASIALRVTPHPLVKILCEQFGGCLVSTSCNPASQPPARTLEQASAYFADDIHYLAGDTLGFSQPSRIIDAQTGAILRVSARS